MLLRAVLLVVSASLGLVAGPASAKPRRARVAAPPAAPPVAPPPVVAPAPTAAPPAPAGPTAAEVLSRVDAILSPPEFEARLTFLTHKPKGDRTFSMSLLRKGDRFRTRFLSPPDDAGAEVLRVVDDFWHYLPNLKRSLKISAKQEFHGGDFANGDVLALDMTRDYVPTFGEGAPPDQWVLELAARNDSVTYARIRVFVRKQDGQPVVLEYFSGAGRMVRRMELSEPKAFGSLVRPRRLVMHNALEPGRSSELIYDSFAVRSGLDDAHFDQTTLGR